jgi:hypothetical protein
MQARPPDTMENSADTRLATAPDSRSPSPRAAFDHGDLHG